MRDVDRNIRRHSRLEFQIGITDTNHGVVGNHVLHSDRRIAHLHNFSAKSARWKRVHREIDILIGSDNADICLGHIRIDLHFSKIIRDRENDGRLQAGCDGLAHVDIARDDDAVDWRSDRAVFQIGARFVERALLDFHICFRLAQARHG